MWSRSERQKAVVQAGTVEGLTWQPAHESCMPRGSFNRLRAVDLVLLMSRKALASVVFIVISVIEPGLAPNG